ncbi:MAG: cytochrome c oxidase subunit III [Candidatus Poribacteria bacterium]|nr:MAG: cytochrome c oxidase subunit III [Candidatus Poribacteria bacterium]
MNHSHTAESDARLFHQFADMEQQHESWSLGMWVFLASEVLFFGALIFSFLLYRSVYWPTFLEGTHELDLVIGGINTAILLTSSFTMVLAVYTAQNGNHRMAAFWLIVTSLLGLAFIGVKIHEYGLKWEHHLIPIQGLEFEWHGEHPQQARMFFSFYFTLTGLHALHVLVGILAIWVVAYRVAKNHFGNDYMPVEIMGLYWHFVDLVWIFLYPILYLFRA